MKKVLYFTANTVPTAAEKIEIAALVAIAADPYEVVVQSGKPKATLTGVKLSAIASDNSYNDAGATITAGTIAADSTDNSITDSGNGFVTAGFQVGDLVTVSGFTGSTANNASRIATSVAAGKIIFGGADGDTIVTDAAGESVTASAPGRFLLRGFKVGQHIMVRGFTGNVANNISDGVITAPLTATKMIVGGTDGDVIVNDASGESVTICTVDTDASYGNVEVVADYIAGTPPEQYKSAGSPIYTAFSVTDPPNPDNLIATQRVVTSGDVITITGGTGTTSLTVTVAAGAFTAAVLS